MIGHLNGILSEKSGTELIIDCNGVGYQVYSSVNTTERLPEEGEEIKLYCLLISREDSTNLYGFGTKSEREAFKLLISISGIGPKVALSILSSLTVEELQQNIVEGNTLALRKMPGIGNKTAERLILELKDKILKISSFEKSGYGQTQNLIRQEALSALNTLGYSRAVADKAIIKAFEESADKNLTAEQLIKLSLKFANA
jgi:holliday junction DNA helicase RuvA